MMKRLLSLLTIFIGFNSLSFAQTFEEVSKVVETVRQSENQFGEHVAVYENYAVVGVQRENKEECLVEAGIRENGDVGGVVAGEKRVGAAEGEGGGGLAGRRRTVGVNTEHEF